VAEESLADLCDVGDAQPLALCRASHDGYSVDRIFPAADCDPHYALARSLCNQRHRSPLPRTHQVVPDSIRRTFADRLALCRTQPLAGESG